MLHIVSSAVLRRAVPGIAIAAALFAGCKIPEAPEWDVGLAVPFSSDPIAISDFLPASVQVVDVGGQPVFQVDPQADSVEYTLGQMCSACGALQGIQVPVPSFEYEDSLDVNFPADLFSVEIVAAQFTLRVYNGLNFDPLRPGAGGYVALALRDIASGTLVDSAFIDGATESLPSGTTRQLVFALSSLTLSEGVRIYFHVWSPADGQTVVIDNGLRIELAATLDQLQVGAVTAVVDGESLDESFFVDVDQDLRDEIAERVQAAEYEIELIHSLEIAGSLAISIAGSPADLFSGDPLREVRLSSLNFAPGVKQTGELTPEQVQLIADFADVYLGYLGTASGTRTGPQGQLYLSRFTPAQQLQANLKLTTTVRVSS